MDRRETYHFVVVCPNAEAVFLLGDFNGWSTSATPMRNTERDVWQIDIEMPAAERRFSYFVIDSRYRTGRAPFGSTFLLPGTWAKVVRSAAPLSGPRGQRDAKESLPAQPLPNGRAAAAIADPASSPASLRSDLLN